MPHVAVRLPHGRTTPAQRSEFAAALTPAVLEAEGLPVTPLTSAITWIDVTESEPAGWSVAGEPVEQRTEVHAFVRVTTPAGLLTDGRRTALLQTLNQAVVDLFGGDPLGGLGVWVVIDEVPEGRFGVAGGALTADLLKASVAATVPDPVG